MKDNMQHDDTLKKPTTPVRLRKVGTRLDMPIYAFSVLEGRPLLIVERHMWSFPTAGQGWVVKHPTTRKAIVYLDTLDEVRLWIAKRIEALFVEMSEVT